MSHIEPKRRRRISPRRLWTGAIVIGAFLVLIGLLASCGGSVPGASNQNDGRKTKYDNVRVQKIALTNDEGGGFVLCITDFHEGQAIACDFSQAGRPG